MSSSNNRGEGNQRTRTGCTNCRLRHLKCDNVQPSCSRCSKRGEKCVREYNVRFKHYSRSLSSSTSTKQAKPKLGQYTFPSDQTWCDPGHTLAFIEEGQSPQSLDDSRLESDLDEDEDQDGTALPSIGDGADTTTVTINPLPISNEDNDHHNNDEAEVGLFSYSPISGLDKYVWSNSENTQLERPASAGVAIAPSITDSSKDFPLYQDVSMWPLNNATEARLVRYFIEHVARRFDMCDAERHFAQVVPWRAAVCPPLMDAVLSLSARYLSRTTGFDEFVSDRYFQRCINSLVPMLSDPEVLLNPDLFAAVVVLRTLEEIEVPLSGADSRTHLFGSHLFVSASTGQSPSSSLRPLRRSSLTGLRRASFLVSFRQELYTAFVSQRPVIQAFLPYDIERSVDKPAGDCTWTNRVLLHVADVLDFCFNSNTFATDISIQRYEDLVAYGESWYAKKPRSFSPIYFGDANAETVEESSPKTRSISPHIWLLSDAVAAGLLNYHLSRIMLLAFDPRTPRIGPSRTSYLKRQNNEIKQEVRTLIGIAKGNLGCPPHFVWACMGITLGGDRFDERWEQEELLDILKVTASLYAWSTSTAQQHLMEAWGWMDTAL